jgi:hypothetical protein
MEEAVYVAKIFEVSDTAERNYLPLEARYGGGV